MDLSPYAMPLRQMLTVLAWCAAGLVGVFLVLALVRLWAWRTQHRGGSCGGIDLARLREQRRRGEITQAEYEAIRGAVLGASTAEPAGPAASSSETDVPPSQDGGGTGTEKPAPRPSIQGTVDRDGESAGPRSERPAPPPDGPAG